MILNRSFKFLDLEVELMGKELNIRYPNGAVAKEIIDDDFDLLFYLEFHLSQRKFVNLTTATDKTVLQ